MLCEPPVIGSLGACLLHVDDYSLPPSFLVFTLSFTLD